MTRLVLTLSIHQSVIVTDDLAFLDYCNDDTLVSHSDPDAKLTVHVSLLDFVHIGGVTEGVHRLAGQVFRGVVQQITNPTEEVSLKMQD